MRKQGPFTLRHMVVAAAVVAVILGQLLWWLVYGLRENRVRRDLQEQRLEAQCAREASRIASALADAAADAGTAIAAGLEPDRQHPPARFSECVPVPPERPCVPGWNAEGGALWLTLPTGDACLALKARPEWLAGLFNVSSELTVVDAVATAEGPGRAASAMSSPFADRAVVARPEALEQIRSDYRDRVLMLASEGVFFVLLMAALIVILSRTWRRETELEHQHRNFLSAITHELKSPLASMRLSLETVLRGRADGTASLRFLENALQDTERLQSLVQKVLEVTRYGEGGGNLSLRKSNLSEVLVDGVHSFERRATTMGVQVDVEVRPEVWVDLDEEAFLIVISNLLENAVKYGGTIPRVGVHLEVEGGQALLDVMDNGKGVPFADLDFIFDRFYRGGDEMTRIAQGTGLGLYLVKQIVTAHHGTVAVAASGPHGSMFRVTLPNAEVWEERR